MLKTVQNVLDANNSPKVLTVSPDETVQSAIEIMAQKRIRHLPVVQDNALVGMVSISDLIRTRRERRQ